MSAILVENLSKCYKIGRHVRHDTLRDSISHGVRNLFTSFGRGPRADEEDFWALRDMNFEVKPGEVTGVIGRNGAGKSTLLKILSRITEPSAGKITLRGRVASLLEVGTGFHPELTGRENIFLNGAILGMGRAEIRKKFDEIVAFAEVERFLDTPVKRYSSGMYVRLAFAVAAHLEPEILIVDEVLAVGDAEFQKKCLGKMREVTTGGGRTVVFVSHNAAAIQNLCSRVIYLKGGTLCAQGETHEILRTYAEDNAHFRQNAEIDLSNVSKRGGEGGAFITQLRFTDESGQSATHFAFGQPIRLRLAIQAKEPIRNFVVGFSINSTDGQVIACSNHYDTLPVNELPAGRHVFEVLIDNIWLSPDSYTVTVAITRESHLSTYDSIRDAAGFTVERRKSVSNEQMSKLLDSRPGFMRPPLRWEILPPSL